MNTERSEEVMSSDYEISKNLVLRSVQDQVQRVGKCTESLPEPQPMNDEHEQLILEQVAKLTKDIGDVLDGNTMSRKLISSFALVATRKNFESLVDKVFVGGITWGKIIALICVIGKTVAKIIQNSLPSIVSWTLDYFMKYLQNWICRRGGWVNSIYSLARYSIERDFGSSSGPITLSSVVLFTSGALLGGLFILALKKRG
ncbi:apoptosis regulator BAX [Puntigrus tetrazona]|uniref:apoptosis regulator BAX n=1 Tax=Puntigrus tetrazona TaxID=1606681 RepID=UPI001C88ECF2|nr:apoptosis regulator BAX [Puntigrus tetrazona]